MFCRHLQTKNARRLKQTRGAQTRSITKTYFQTFQNVSAPNRRYAICCRVEALVAWRKFSGSMRNCFGLRATKARNKKRRFGRRERGWRGWRRLEKARAPTVACLPARDDNNERTSTPRSLARTCKKRALFDKTISAAVARASARPPRGEATIDQERRAPRARVAWSSFDAPRLSLALARVLSVDNKFF